MNAKRVETEAEQTPQRKKYNAQRSALRALGETAIEGFDFEVVKVEGGYVWRKLEAAPAPKPDEAVAADLEAALSAVAQVAPIAQPVRFVSLAQLAASPLNPRRTFDDEGIAELADSIAESGILQNLVVRRDPAPVVHPDCFELVSGERRYRALMLLASTGRWDRHADNIPVKVIEGDDAEVLALALLENLQREAVNPMEEAEGMAALHRLDPTRWSTAEIARRIGKTPRHVQLRLALTDRLTDDTRAALRDGRINLAQARVLTCLPPAMQVKTVQAIVEGKSWTTRAEDLVRGIFADLVPAGLAIFDVAASGLAVVEDDQGSRWLEKPAFKKAQAAAVDARVEALGSEWAWAERSSYFYAGGFETERTEDRSIGGAIVAMDWNGIVTVETGLVRRDDESAETGDEADAERARDHNARQAAQQELQARLWDGLHGDETAALALCAYGLLCHDHHYGQMPTQIAADTDWTTPRLRQAFPELTGYETDERRGDPDDRPEDAGLFFTHADDRPGLFAALLSWPKAKLSKLIAAIAADSVVLNGFHQAPHPVTAALLDRFAVPPPAFWQPEPADPAAPTPEETEDA